MNAYQPTDSLRGGVFTMGSRPRLRCGCFRVFFCLCWWHAQSRHFACSRPIKSREAWPEPEALARPIGPVKQLKHRTTRTAHCPPSRKKRGSRSQLGRCGRRENDHGSNRSTPASAPLHSIARTRGEACGKAAKEGRNHCSRVGLWMATKTTQ